MVRPASSSAVWKSWSAPSRVVPVLLDRVRGLVRELVHPVHRLARGRPCPGCRCRARRTPPAPTSGRHSTNCSRRSSPPPQPVRRPAPRTSAPITGATRMVVDAPLTDAPSAPTPHPVTPRHGVHAPSPRADRSSGPAGRAHWTGRGDSRGTRSPRHGDLGVGRAGRAARLGDHEHAPPSSSRPPSAQPSPTVNDPEIKRPITELGMVESVSVDEAGVAAIRVLLTVAGCPLKDTINRDVTAAVEPRRGRQRGAARPRRDERRAARRPAGAAARRAGPARDPLRPARAR